MKSIPNERLSGFLVQDGIKDKDGDGRYIMARRSMPLVAPLWNAEELKIPVYNNEDGNFLSLVFCCK